MDFSDVSSRELHKGRGSLIGRILFGTCIRCLLSHVSSSPFRLRSRKVALGSSLYRYWGDSALSPGRASLQFSRSNQCAESLTDGARQLVQLQRLAATQPGRRKAELTDELRARQQAGNCQPTDNRSWQGNRRLGVSTAACLRLSSLRSGRFFTRHVKTLSKLSRWVFIEIKRTAQVT